MICTNLQDLHCKTLIENVGSFFFISFLEIKLLTKAIKISSLAQIEVMKAIHGEMTEREVQGIHEFIYRKYGAAHILSETWVFVSGGEALPRRL